jgi:hypothetical protein
VSQEPAMPSGGAGEDPSPLRVGAVLSRAQAGTGYQCKTDAVSAPQSRDGCRAAIRPLTEGRLRQPGRQAEGSSRAVQVGLKAGRRRRSRSEVRRLPAGFLLRARDSRAQADTAAAVSMQINIGGDPCDLSPLVAEATTARQRESNGFGRLRRAQAGASVKSVPIARLEPP